MDSVMSNGLLSNPKTALGVAGAVVVMAVAASVGLTSFVSEEEAPVEAVAVEEHTTPAKPVQDAGWADNGAPDDWGASDQDTGDMGGWGDAENAATNAQPAFGSYSPRTSETIDNSGSQSASASPGTGPGRSNAGSRVTAQAADSAPNITPPGGRGSLEQTD
jgi:hypothetical protein